MIVIVALGDSLTAGFQSPTPQQPYYQEQPYTRFLDAMARTHLRSQGDRETNVVVINSGRNGDSTDSMLYRFPVSVAPEKPDYVIVWGGINDLFGGRTPAEVLQRLSNLYERTRNISATPIACTLTPVSGSIRGNQRIKELNRLMAAHCRRQDIILVDLFTALADDAGVLLPHYSNNGGHLSTEGYMKVAETIFLEAVKVILDQRGAGNA